MASVDTSQSTLLNAVLGNMLGTSVNLTVLDWNAVAQSDISLAEFLDVLAADVGVAGPDEAVNADVSLLQVLDAMTSVAQADGNTALVDALSVLQVPFGELQGTIRLIDLLNVDLPDGSLANIDLDALDLVSGTVQLFNYDNVLTTPQPVTVSGADLGLGGVVNSIELYAQVVESPVFTIAKEGTTFHTAAMRLKLNVDLVDANVDTTTLEDALQAALGAGVSVQADLTLGQVEFYANVARAEGIVTQIDAIAETVTVDATPGIADVYLGTISDSLFYNRTHLIDPVTDLTYANVGTLSIQATDSLGAPLADETTGISAKAFGEGQAPLVDSLLFSGPYPETLTTGSSSTAITNLIADLATTLDVQLDGSLGSVLDPLVDTIVLPTTDTLVTDAIQPTLDTLLTGVVDPQLRLLGIGIGEMDVTISGFYGLPPSALDDSSSTNEDVAVVISVLDNDVDPDGGELTVVDVVQPANGAVTINPDGTLTYTPNADFFGGDSFTYVIKDSDCCTSTAAVNIAVDPVNDAPVAGDDTATTSPNTPQTITVLTNDTDVDGDPLSVDSFTQPASGSVVLNPDGTFSYTPDPEFHGTDSFTYTVTDGNGGTSTATVGLTVDPVNDAPVVNGENVTTDEDTPTTITVLTNDTDVDGDTLSIDGFTQPANGSVVLNPDGTFSYTPDPDFHGTDSFTYTVTDGNGGTSTATVSLTVDPVNDTPVANDDAATTNEDTPTTIDVLANDTDVDGDPLSVDSFTQPASGSVVLNPDGTFSYTPDSDFHGTDSFTYTVTDGNGGTSTATVGLTVDPVNDQPVVSGENVTTNEDAPTTIDVLANDTDVDGDTLSVDSFTQPASGSVVLNPDGTFSYTPDPDFHGTDSFTYTVTDGNGGTSTATVSLTVDPINDTPVANDDAATTNEDAPTTIDVLANDTDVDGDPLSVDSFTQPASGSVVLNPDGTFSYTPDSDFHGTDSFTYTVTDSNGGTSTATVNLTVDPVNDAPVVNGENVTTDEDTPTTITVLTNDTDVDGDPLSVDGFTQPVNGSVVLNPDGTFSYTPDPDFHGADSFTYTVTDGNGGTSTATVNLTVDPVNDTPVANDDAATTAEDAPTTIVVLTNDTDVDGDTLSIDGFTQPANGSVVLNPDGTFSYTPDPDFHGTDSFTYTVTDGNGGTSTATVSLTVDPINDTPVANDDAATTNEDTPTTIAVLANDTDVDGDPLSVDSFTQPASGSVVLNPDGTFSYTPDPDFHGTDSFTYTVTDGNGGTSTATVSLTVDPINDAPVVNGENVTTDEDTPTTIAVLANDTDADGDPLSVDSFTQPASGSVVLNPDGTFSYTPDPDFHGTDSFTYTVTDGNGGTSAATVSLTVDPINDAPVVNGENVTTDEDTPTTIAVLANDTDADGDPLSVDSFTQPASGSVVLNPDGTFSYTPDPEFHGADSFTYTVTDGNGGTSTATVSLTVDPINDAPVVNGENVTTDEDAPTTIDVLANDTDVDGDTLSVDSFTQPASGSVVLNPDGTFSYTPDPDFHGTDSFTYTVTDGNGGTSTATVSLTVDPINDAPVVNGENVTTDEDAPTTIDVLANDTDVDGDTLSVDSFTQPASGSVVLNPDGTFSYTPDPDFHGTDSFTYTVTDGNGGTSAATVSLAVDPVNDAPVANDDAATTNEDTPTTIAVLANDTDADGDTLSVDSFTQPASGSVVLNPDGTFSYTPDPDFHGTDSFTYTVTDGNGGTSTATVSLTVDPINDTPVANDDAATTNEDAPTTIDVLANDTDVDGDPLSVDSFTQPASGSVVLNPDGTFSYTPDSDFHGTDSFTYTVTDGNGGTSTATVSLTVDPINDTPVANDDAATTNEDAPTTITVLTNDTDVDGDPLSVDSFTQPASGSVVLNPDGTFSYTPDSDFHGTDSFTYTVTDSNGGTSTATVNLTVDPVNDQPVAESRFASISEDSTLIGKLSAKDRDSESLTFSILVWPTFGTLRLDASTATYEYLPNVDFNGEDSFQFLATDGIRFDTGIISIQVAPVNDAPVATDVAQTATEDEPISGTLLGSDPDGDSMTYSVLAEPEFGTLSLNPITGEYTYIPDPHYHGLDQFQYEISDGLTTRVASVSLVVEQVNDVPVPGPFIARVSEAGLISGTIVTNDVDGDQIRYFIVSGPTLGIVTTFSFTTGQFQYMNTSATGGTDSFIVRITDGTVEVDTVVVLESSIISEATGLATGS
ncbi:Ig-like domain-containing protein [Kolteria novifilia]|uniref:Ig-like domain-containing protein n=1 Tax=Kolteria novifilia TaxID=2527975 RepID=UPI003AF354C6